MSDVEEHAASRSSVPNSRPTTRRRKWFLRDNAINWWLQIAALFLAFSFGVVAIIVAILFGIFAILAWATGNSTLKQAQIANQLSLLSICVSTRVSPSTYFPRVLCFAGLLSKPVAGEWWWGELPFVLQRPSECKHHDDSGYSRTVARSTTPSWSVRRCEARYWLWRYRGCWVSAGMVRRAHGFWNGVST